MWEINKPAAGAESPVISAVFKRIKLAASRQSTVSTEMLPGRPDGFSYNGSRSFNRWSL